LHFLGKLVLCELQLEGYGRLQTALLRMGEVGAGAVGGVVASQLENDFRARAGIVASREISFPLTTRAIAVCK